MMGKYGKCEECGNDWRYSRHPQGDMLTCDTCNVGWDLEDAHPELQQRVKALSEKYSDLIMQVQVKIPNETRHETARRIIQQHESRKSATAQQEGE